MAGVKINPPVSLRALTTAGGRDDVAVLRLRGAGRPGGVKLEINKTKKPTKQN